MLRYWLPTEIYLVDPSLAHRWRGEAEPFSRLINPIYFRSQSKTKLISVSQGLSSDTFFFYKKQWFTQTHVYIASHLVQLNSFKLRIISLTFKYSLKIFALTIFVYNILLLFSCKRFFLSSAEIWAKSWFCHFVLFQTKHWEFNIQWVFTFIFKNFKF